MKYNNPELVTLSNNTIQMSAAADQLLTGAGHEVYHHQGVSQALCHHCHFPHLWQAHDQCIQYHLCQNLQHPQHMVAFEQLLQGFLIRLVRLLMVRPWCVSEHLPTPFSTLICHPLDHHHNVQ